MIQTNTVKSNALFGGFLIDSNAKNRTEANTNFLQCYQINFLNF